ncbi:MAG: metallophosphoesterase family protein [Clostridia bacterium]|nr:metallophosphoesterase family protein [Clostridia bacterium]
MKIVMLADLHGNLPATLAMEKHLEKVQPDEIFFLGDAVGKGPSNAETCDWVRNRCTLCLGGNWDYGIGGKEFPEDGYF